MPGRKTVSTAENAKNTKKGRRGHVIGGLTYNCECLKIPFTFTAPEIGKPAKARQR